MSFTVIVLVVMASTMAACSGVKVTTVSDRLVAVRTALVAEYR